MIINELPPNLKRQVLKLVNNGHTGLSRLNESFIWSDTSQGHTFWSILCWKGEGWEQLMQREEGRLTLKGPESMVDLTGSYLACDQKEEEQTSIFRIY